MHLQEPSDLTIIKRKTSISLTSPTVEIGQISGTIKRRRLERDEMEITSGVSPAGSGGGEGPGAAATEATSGGARGGGRSGL